MKEIVQIQIGRAGNAVGTKFWEGICREHGVNPCGYNENASDDRMEKIRVFFHRTRKNRLIPRAVLADLDVEPLAEAYYSYYGSLFRQTNYVGSYGGTGGNIARGMYTEGKYLLGDVLNAARREAERCDCFEGFQVVHSIGGGTGSGLGASVLENIRDVYPGRYLTSFSIVPASNIVDDIMRMYNAVIALHHLTELDMTTFCMDNKSFEHTCEFTLGAPKAGYLDLNNLISAAMVGVTTTCHLPGRLNEGPARRSINMVPFPRLHYLSAGFAPVVYEGMTPSPLEMETLAKEMVNPENLFLYPPSEGKYMTANYIFRGKCKVEEVRQHSEYIFKKFSRNYIDWLPDNKKVEACPVPFLGLERSVIVIGNTTGVQNVFKRVKELFDALHKCRRYTHHFLAEGITDDELDQAQTSLADLIAEYKSCEEAADDDIWPEFPVRNTAAGAPRRRVICKKYRKRTC